VVYRAVDGVLDRPVAVKLLAERFASDTDIRRRFRREALAAARLSGEPNTVTVFDVGEWRGTPFIVMEYLSGGTLAEALRRGAQPPERALRWLDQAAIALDAAHARGVVHRDVKPANVLLDDRANVRVADFGIATAAGLDAVTMTGTVLGTAGYLAPEQAQGRPVSAATDEYALAVVAFELLTGTRPFVRDSPAAEAAAHAYEVIPAASRDNPALPLAVDAVFETALAKDPSARFASCGELVSALRAAWAPRAEAATRPFVVGLGADAPTRVIRRRRRRGPAIAAGLLLFALAGLAGALAALVLHPSRPTTASEPPRTITTTTTVTSRPPTPTTTRAAAQPSPTNANDLNTRGYRLMLTGDYTAALPLLRQAVAGLTNPGNPVTAYANFNLGQTLVRLGQCSSALPYLQRAQQLEPSRPEVRTAIDHAEQCATTPPTPSPGRAGSAHGRGHHGNQNNDHQD
jgi:serine/threonine-protein kinase